MLDGGVAAREEQRLAPVVVPADAVRGFIPWTFDREHLAVAVGLSDAVAVDHDPVADSCMQGRLLSSELTLRRPAYAG